MIDILDMCRGRCCMGYVVRLVVVHMGVIYLLLNGGVSVLEAPPLVTRVSLSRSSGASDRPRLNHYLSAVVKLYVCLVARCVGEFMFRRMCRQKWFLRISLQRICEHQDRAILRYRHA